MVDVSQASQKETQESVKEAKLRSEVGIETDESCGLQASVFDDMVKKRKLSPM